MRKSLIGVAAGAALTLSAGTAFADGYGYGSVKDVPMVAPQVNWNGLYIGAAVGYGIASTELELGEIGYGSINFDGISSEGFQGNVTLGYDRQIHQNLVFGVFGDYSFGELETELSISSGPSGLDLSVAEITDSWAIGARLGFVRSCCTMWYVAAGYAQADLELIGFGSKSMDGYFIGGGVEQQLHDNLFLKLDYRYTDYGKVSWYNDGEEFFDTETDVHSIRLGVNWKMDLFGGRHAAPAYYALK